jgi:hypothetical protein
MGAATASYQTASHRDGTAAQQGAAHHISIGRPHQDQEIAYFLVSIALRAPRRHQDASVTHRDRHQHRDQHRRYGMHRCDAR